MMPEKIKTEQGSKGMKEYMIQTTGFRFTIKAHELEVYTRGESSNTDPFTYLLAYAEDGEVIGYFENVIWYMEKSAYIEIEEVDNESKQSNMAQ